MSKALGSKFFLHFSKYTFEIQKSLNLKTQKKKKNSLKTSANYSKYIGNLFNKISFEGRDNFEMVVTNRYGHKNIQ